MNEEKCEECGTKQYSCNYLRHRFGVTECTIGKELIINKVHLKELYDREMLLERLGKQ